MSERVGCVEIRWTDDGDPDDVVAPWPRNLDGTPITVHVERMNDGDIWMEITDEAQKLSTVMWFRAVRKNELEWTVTERRDYGELA